MKMKKYSNHNGFTIVELLVVVAVIGLLVAILIPTVANVRESAKKAQSRSQFGQWISAIEMFRTEYGYWPDFNAKPGDNWAATPLNAENNLVVRVNETSQIKRNFIEFLSGRHANGERWDPQADFDYKNHPNRRRTAFYDFTENDFDFISTPYTLKKDASNIELRDSFENTDILIVMDGNQDGVIRLDDKPEYRVSPPENSQYGEANRHAVAPYEELRDVRASVLVYSVGPWKNREDDQRDAMILTW